MNKVRQQNANKLHKLLTPENPEDSPDILEDEGRLRDLIETCLLSGDSPLSPCDRKTLYKELHDGVPLTGADGLRKKLAAVDISFFGRAYLPHYFSRPSPEFHKELDTLWLDRVLKGCNPLQEALVVNKYEGNRAAVAAPRGHAKSTNLTFKDTLHAILYAYKHYIILLSDTSYQAMGFLESIKDELEDNEALREDFGELEGSTWRENVAVTKTNIKIEAIGAGQKIRGRKHKNWRPDLIVLDDIENDENVRTPEQRQKLRNWFDKAVAKAGDDYTDFIYIGTILHYDSLLVNIMKRATYKSIKYKAVLSFSSSPLWDEWELIMTNLSNESRAEEAREFFESNKKAMLEGTEVLWEEKNSYYQLMVTKVEEGQGSFNSELQNEPINPEDSLFNEEWFDYYNPHEHDFSSKDYAFYGFLDPSLGKSRKSDYSAIQTIALHKPSGYMYDIDADIERRHPDAIIEDTLEKAIWLKKTYNQKYVAFGCETNQFQWFLKEQLAKASARCGIYLPLVEISQSSDKVLRVQTLQPDLKNKYLKLNKRHTRLIEQLKFFPMADHDDGPDALEGCRTLAQGGNKKRLQIRKRRFGL